MVSPFIQEARALARACKLTICLGAGIAGCAAEEGYEGDDVESATAPLVGSVTPLVQGIGDAENATFTPDGRLFVTGGANAYEITKAPTGYVATPIYAGNCNFTGIVARGGYLYATCAEGTDPGALEPHLLVSSLAGKVELEVVYDFQKLGFPNGIAFDEQGRLFVNDFTPLAGKIVVLSFRSPLEVEEEIVWHDRGHPLANGLKIFEGKVYMTDLNQVKVIPIEPDGSAGRVSVLATRIGILDDLYVSKSGIIVGDFYGGQLVYYTHSGRMVKQTRMLFQSPSSITPGVAPLVPEGSLVVTEKGELGELASTVGNRVSLYQP